jgi:hypothetical protein
MTETPDNPETSSRLFIRKTGGSVEPMSSDSQFVEMRDEQGALAFVVHRDSQGAVHIILPNTPAADRYTRLYGTRFCTQVINLNPKL